MKYLFLSKVMEIQMKYMINNTNGKLWILNYGVVDEDDKKCVLELHQ